jgi:hypothetical protein
MQEPNSPNAEAPPLSVPPIPPSFANTINLANGVTATPLFPTISIPLSILPENVDFLNIKLEDLSDAQLKEFEGTLRTNLKARVEFLQSVQSQITQLTLQMNRYMTATDPGKGKEPDINADKAESEPGTSTGPSARGLRPQC